MNTTEGTGFRALRWVVIRAAVFTALAGVLIGAAMHGWFGALVAFAYIGGTVTLVGALWLAVWWIAEN